MSISEIGNPPTTLDALVEHLREADSGGETDMWERADLTLAHMREKLTEAVPRGGLNVGPTLRDLSFQNEAAREVAREVVNRAKEEKILVDGRDPNERTIRDWAENAYVWSPEDRVEGASFRAHFLLRSPKYKGRRKVVLEQLKRKGGGRVPETAVHTWISAQKPGEKQTFLEKVERRLRSAVKSAAAPWEATTYDDRHQIAKVLRQIAREIEDGTF